MLNKVVIKIFATGALNDLKRIRPDMAETSFEPVMLINWAHVECCIKFDDFTAYGPVYKAFCLAARVPDYFDLPPLHLAGIAPDFDINQIFLPPDVVVTGKQLSIKPPKSTLGGGVITPESVKIFRVDGFSLIEEAEYKCKASESDIKHKTKAEGFYCVVASNLLGYGIPARNVEVK